MMMAAMALSPCVVRAQGVLLPDYATAGQGMASARDLAMAIAGMRKAIGDKSIAVQPVVRGDGANAALEFWAKPLPPAVHSGEVEYVTVIEGSAKVIYGGTLSSAREIRPGLLQGDAIVGGQTRELHPGDVLLIPRACRTGLARARTALRCWGSNLPRRRLQRRRDGARNSQ
jgi:mannose-6-phosphate isomerase-like protein (cupin superfamily)